MRSLDEAISAIEETFEQRESAGAPLAEHKIGGGAQNPDALWSSPEDALRSFVDIATSLLEFDGATAFAFLEGPHLDKWEITIKGVTGTHRIAEPRWSVIATIGVVE